MAQSVLTRPKVALSVDRSPADRSLIGNFHSHAGLIDMVLCEPCIAGTKGVINRKSFTRSSQVLFPAFINVKEYYDFFKVPLRYLWSRWNDWKLNINDLNSTMQNTLTPRSGANPAYADLSLPTFSPRLDFKGLYSLYEQTIPNNLSFMTEANNFLRLCERCGYKLRGSSDAQSNTLNLFKAAAYQKVYYDHFRNTTYESNNPFAYNFDWLYKGGDSTNASHLGQLNSTDADHADVIRMLFKMRYVNWQNDFFHNIYPALNYTISSPNGNNWSVPSSVVYTLSSITNAEQGSYITQTSSSGGQVIVNYPQRDYTSPSVMSAQQIRAAFALDKLLRASAFTPKHVKDQLKARFGVDVGDKVSYESERLGGFVSEVNFGEVTQTVDTSSAGSPSNLGQVGGKGVGLSEFENDLNFYCEEDSLIVGVHYFIPTAIYDSVQDEWSQKLQREDFFQPEFQNLGLRPIVNKNLQGSSLLGAYANSILGYTVPNEVYKIGKNQNFMMFNTRYNNFVYDSVNSKFKFNSGQSNPLQAFVTHGNYSAQVYNTIDADYFKVKPSSLDPLFAEQFDGSPETDQFFGSYRIKFAVVHPMDVHGQPSL